LGDPNRPLGSFLFLRPTGVGKTELARALAGFLSIDERALVGSRCRSNGEKHSVARLLGAPPGLRRLRRGRQLTEAVRRRSVLPCYFFERDRKGDADVFNVSLQILGRRGLTDGQGRARVDFKEHQIVIMTRTSARIASSDVSGRLHRRWIRE